MSVLVSLQAYAGMKICVACSGGADSVALLHAFYAQAKEHKIILSALTCEHGIRGESSLRDMVFVRRLCKDWGIPLYEFSADVPALARASGRGLEEEARRFRYDCFENIVARGDADAVATAHHRDDLAETVLFRLARGTSLAGIDAIRERAGIVRPFLCVSKAEILNYIRENDLPFVTDETNGDEAFSRNAIRIRVLPALEEIVSGAGEHIADFARRAGEDDGYLQALALAELTRENGELYIPVSLPRPLFLRAAVAAIKELKGSDYSENLLREIEKLKGLQSGRRVCFCGAEAIREGDGIVFYRPQEKFTGEIPFTEGSFNFDGWRVGIVKEEIKGTLYADRDKFPDGCVLRTRRAGDKFTPFGGKQKPLKKFLTDRKIPARTSARLPVIAMGDTVYAVLGVEISDCVKVTENTLNRIFLTCEKSAT